MTAPTSTPTISIHELVDEYLATWTEPDERRRRTRMAACWATDGSLVDPPLDGRGHDGINDLMVAMQHGYPGHVFARTSDVELHHDTFRVAWELRGPGDVVALRGIDVGAIDEAGLITRINGFFGEIPDRGDR